MSTYDIEFVDSVFVVEAVGANLRLARAVSTGACFEAHFSTEDDFAFVEHDQAGSGLTCVVPFESHLSEVSTVTA